MIKNKMISVQSDGNGLIDLPELFAPTRNVMSLNSIAGKSANFLKFLNSRLLVLLYIEGKRLFINSDGDENTY